MVVFDMILAKFVAGDWAGVTTEWADGFSVRISETPLYIFQYIVT